MALARHLFLIALIVFIFFFTPKCISDSIWHVSSGSMQFVFRDPKKSKHACFRFDHFSFDGSLISMWIRQNYHRIARARQRYCRNMSGYAIYPVQTYQKLESLRHENHTRFASSVARLLRDIVKVQKRSLNISVYVSTRGFRTNKGNFIKFARYRVQPGDSINDICNAHRRAVRNVTLEYPKWLPAHTTLYDFIKGHLGVDYAFNSWRNLSSIPVSRTNTLERLPTNPVRQEEIKDLILNKRRGTRVVTVDLFRNSYFITNIEQIF